MVRSRSIIATPPGATIKEQLVDRGMSQKEFSERMDMSEKHISRLINGEVQLTPDMAVRLEMVLGVPAQFWSKLETIYREKLAKANIENAMDADIALVRKFPYREMAQNGWVPEADTSEGKVFGLRKHFEVVNLGLINSPYQPQIACRRLADTEKADYALLAWAQRAKVEARRIETNKISTDKLWNVLNEIRSMTTMDPEVFCPKIMSVLADCGVAIVFLPHIGGSFLHGATFYDKDKIILGLTVRGKDADKFWFSLFHELGHILLGHLSNSNGTTEEDENKADAFARDTLIPDEVFERFTSSKQFTKASIIQFANYVGVDPGIVVGRLQKEGYIEFAWHNDLKTKYIIA